MDSKIQLLQNIESQATDANTAVGALDLIAAIINEVVGTNENTTSIQAILNLGFRIYYKLLYKYKLKDNHFEELFDGTLNEKQVGKLVMINSVLLSERGKHIDAHTVRESFLVALRMNSSTLLILKNINLLLRKHPKLDTETTLAQIYVYLQSNETGMREEALLFFNHCCRPVERGRKFFQFIVTHYPWTNRNKFYMLSCILNHHILDEFLDQKTHKYNEFFAGLRLSLSYKHLLPASQYLIKSLSIQSSPHLLELSATILTIGTFKEVQNFYSNWFSRIHQKDILFQLLLSKEEVQKSLLDFLPFKKSSEEYPFILIFVMYSHQILEISKLHFFKIITELIMNCFEFENDAKYLIYKFVADNMCCFALEDCLEFLFEFIKHHRSVENAQMRNNILGKISTIINYTAKEFVKSQKCIDSSSLHASIELFFNRLDQIVVEDIESKIYQPKIFSLKLLDILLKSLYQENLEKIAKNSNLAQNKQLGIFLISRRIFDAVQVTEQLVKALNDPQGFDDALDLIVELLQRLQIVEPEIMIEPCQKCCQSVDLDECSLSIYYAKAAIQANKNGISSSILYNYAFDRLRKEIPSFQRDALLCCKTRNHLFGYLATVNEVLLNSLTTQGETVDFKYTELLDLIEIVQRMVLEFLNVNGQYDEQLFAASFHDMDTSLQVLVEQSKFNNESHEECRKFLLMSFWLTLKTCCDTATTLGFHFTRKQQNLSFDDSVINITAYTKDIKRCLNLHTTLLTTCRHKGAIEEAGLCIGKLIRKITSYTRLNADINKILWDDCLSLLFDNQKSVSTTRRGAGYPIMFLNIIKNEYAQRGRPLLKRAMTQIFEILESKSASSMTEKSNCDRIEALILHCLCVLVKDSEIRNAIYPYYNEIMLAAISKIDDGEWTVCNAALQLFGALVSKIVGQRQATEFEEPFDWEPTQVTYTEILHNMSKTFEQILNYCKEKAHKSSSTRSIILFLGFLNKIEHLYQDTEDNDKIMVIRKLMWSLLQHDAEKVRKLAADCFVRVHDFRHLSQILLQISDVVFQVRNENFFEGLLFVIAEGFSKIQNEAVYTISSEELSQFQMSLRENLIRNAKFETNFKPYTQSRLLDMLTVVGLDKNSSPIRDLINSLALNISNAKFLIGYEEWSQNVQKFRKEN